MKVEIPDYLVPRIQQKAQENGLEMEAVIQQVLDEAFGVEKSIHDLTNEEYVKLLEANSGVFDVDLNFQSTFTRQELYAERNARNK